MDLFTLASGSWWYEFWNSIWLLVCQGIYIFIGALYQVYEKVASVNLFSTDVFEEITGRIYIVMGIAMLFIFAYNLILLIINPDEKKGTSNMTKVIKETIISLVLVILLPTIFNYLYVFQSDVLESNIIGNIVLGNVGSTSNDSANCKDGDYDCTCNFEGYGLENYNNDKGWRFWASSTTDKTQFITDACNSYKNDKTASQRGAYAIAPTIFSAFYRPANFDFTDCVNYLQTKDESVIKDDEDKKICVNYFYDVTASKYTGNIRPFSNDTYLKDIISDSSKESMEFHWIMAVVAGGLAVYMFLCYAMEVGVRVAKLGFLQLISPIPVMMRIIPGQKEKIFTKWLNHMKTTYLDVFIRVLIIDFALFGISLVPDVMSTLWNSSTTGDGNFFIKALATVFVILGILKFAQDAPALFKEFFGDAGSFKLRSPGKQLSENKLAMGGLGMATGGLMNMGGNYYKSTHDENGNKIEGASKGKALASAAGGLVGGARRGAIHGTKAKDWSTFKNEMNLSKSETDYARYKRAEKNRAGLEAINNKLGLEGDDKINSSIIGGIVGTGLSAKDSISNFGDYIKADHAGNVQSAAATELLSIINGAKDSYKTANVKNNEARRDTANENLSSGDPISFLDGKIFTQDKNTGMWKSNIPVKFGKNPDGTDMEKIEFSGDEMKNKVIKDYYKEEERKAFADEYAKNPAAFKNNTDAIMKSLNDNIGNFGQEFTKNLMDKLKDNIADSVMRANESGNTDIANELSDLRINGIDELSNAMNKLRERAVELEQSGEKSKSQDVWKALYDINDGIEDQVKRKDKEYRSLARKDKK